MKFSVISLFPELVQSSLQFGVIGQALKKEIFQVSFVNPRDFTNDVHRTVDDRPFGGGDGMVMLAEPILKAFESLGQKDYHSVYLTPQGAPLKQSKVKELSQKKHLVLLCGRYGGIDQRALNTCVDEEISIGDFVASGGELPAALLIDAVTRYLPGVLGHQSSVEDDSFKDNLLEGPSFTRPQNLEGKKVPEIYLSGHHEKIHKFKDQLSLYITSKLRPDLLSEKQKTLAMKAELEVKKIPAEDKINLGIDKYE